MTNALIHIFIRDAENTGDSRVREKFGVLSGAVGLACNLFLFALKLIIGLLTGSISIAADAFNNLSDAGSSVVTLFTAMGFVSGIKKRTVVRRRPGRPLGSNAVY